MRHNWKTRKFVLCEQPARLYYCKPTKVGSRTCYIMDFQQLNVNASQSLKKFSLCALFPSDFS